VKDSIQKITEAKRGVVQVIEYKAQNPRSNINASKQQNKTKKFKKIFFVN
jgi:hypothetical protein